MSLNIRMKDEAIRYLYDGNLAGFYCCVHESVYSSVMPASIEPEHTAQPSLFEQKRITTDMDIARRVRASVKGRISKRALELVEVVFLSCIEEKELSLLRFLLLGYKEGAKTDMLVSHPSVNKLLKAERHYFREWHLLRGFIRFTDYGGMLAAEITPKNFVLPYLAEHFIDRYPNENLLIHDKTHSAALIWHNKSLRIVRVEDMELKAPSEEEGEYQRLWKRYYDTIAIRERYNPKCRMTLMPKRYWENMLEMQGEE